MRGPGWIQGVDGRETSGSGVAVPAARPLTNLLCVARAAGERRQGDKEPGNEGLKGSESLLDIDDLNMIEFDPPISGHFSHIAQMGLICPDGVSFCPDYHPQPLFFTQPSHTPLGDM